MIEVKGPADLAVGDQVEVRDFDSRGMGKTRRGVVEKIGKTHALVSYQGGESVRVPYARKETYRVFRRHETRIFHPIRKLTARDIWLEQEPLGSVAWSAGHSDRTIVIHSSTVRDHVESAIAAIHAYSEWLQREPKEGA